MKITWTELGVECSLAVYWRSEDGNSVNSRFATLVDLKRASEVAGMRLAVLEAEHAAYLDALAVDGLRPTTVMIGIESLKSSLAGVRETLVDADAAIARAEKADHDLTTARERIAERDLAKRDFALANEAYDELQARFDDLASSPERIALLEALEPHDPNAARAAVAMKREHEATRAVLGAREGEDLLAAARRAVGSADLYKTHYRRTVIANSMTDRAMTEGLAECERLRARIAELEAKPEGWKNCLIARAVAGGVELMVKPAPSGFDVRVVMDNGEKLLASYADGIAGTKVPALIDTMLTEVGA